MTVLPLVNNSTATLFPERSAGSDQDAGRLAFDHQLKDAGGRLDKPKPATAEPKSRQAADDQAVNSKRTARDDDTVEPSNDTPASSDTADSQRADHAPQPSAHADGSGQAGQDTPGQPAQPGVQAHPNAAEAQARNKVAQEVQTPATSQAQVQVVVSSVSAVAQQTQGQHEAAVQAATATANLPQRVSQAVVAQPKTQSTGQPSENLAQQQATSSANTTDVTQALDGNPAHQSDSQDASRQESDKQTADAQTPSLASTQTAGTAGSLSTAPSDPSAAGPPSGAVSTQVTSQAPAQAAQVQPVTSNVQVDDDDNTQLNTARIARGLHNAVQQKGGAVTLRLTPPEMGTVRIQLQIQNGTVNAQFHAETESTRTMLNQQLSQLRSSLEHQGLSVDRLSVQPMQPSSNATLQHESQNDREGQPHDGRSRGGFTRQGGEGGQRQGADAKEQAPAFDDALNHAA